MVLALLDDDHQPNSTPKLSLFKLPCKLATKEPPLAAITMLTPPLRPPVSVPFRWEVAPGKPRATAADGNAPAKNSVIRSLELPPRLVSMQEEYIGKANKIPSPTTVLDGPYVGRSMSLACTFSFRKGSTVALNRDEDEGPTKEGIGGVVRFGSGRWGSFKEDYGGKVRRGSSEISRTTLGDMMRSEDHHNVKITRVRRRRSFFGLSSKNSKLLGGIYMQASSKLWLGGRR